MTLDWGCGGRSAPTENRASEAGLVFECHKPSLNTWRRDRRLLPLHLFPPYSVWEEQVKKQTPDKRKRMRTAIVTVALLVAVLTMIVTAAGGIDVQAANDEPCFEDQVFMWDGRTDDHTTCVNIDDVVDRGIEVAIQNGVLEFTEEWRTG